MAAERHYNVFVGSSSGLFKGVNTKRRQYKNLNLFPGCERRFPRINVLIWGNPEETEVCMGFANRVVKLYDIQTQSINDVFEATGGMGDLIGLAKYNNHFITCTDSGLVKVWDGNESESKIEFEVGQRIYKMNQNVECPSIIVTGGKENEVKIWNLENTKLPIFEAKYVPIDVHDSNIPLWVTDVQFIPNSDKFVACTTNHDILLYDPKSPQKQPVVIMEFDKFPLTALSVAHQENYVFVGNSRGCMGLLDFRKQFLVHYFKPFNGCIRSVQCHAQLPLVASCGTDRQLRLHNIITHQRVHTAPLGSSLSCLLFKTDSPCYSAMGLESTNISSAIEQGKEDNVAVKDELWEKNDEASVEEIGKRKLSFQDANQRLSKTIKFDTVIENSIGEFSKLDISKGV